MIYRPTQLRGYLHRKSTSKRRNKILQPYPTVTSYKNITWLFSTFLHNDPPPPTPSSYGGGGGGWHIDIDLAYEYFGIGDCDSHIICALNVSVSKSPTPTTLAHIDAPPYYYRHGLKTQFLQNSDLPQRTEILFTNEFTKLEI